MTKLLKIKENEDDDINETLSGVAFLFFLFFFQNYLE